MKETPVGGTGVLGVDGTNRQAGWLAGIPSAGYMLAVIPLVSLTDRSSKGEMRSIVS